MHRYPIYVCLLLFPYQAPPASCRPDVSSIFARVAFDMNRLSPSDMFPRLPSMAASFADRGPLIRFLSRRLDDDKPRRSSCRLRVAWKTRRAPARPSLPRTSRGRRNLCVESIPRDFNRVVQGLRVQPAPKAAETTTAFGFTCTLSNKPLPRAS